MEPTVRLQHLHHRQPAAGKLVLPRHPAPLSEVASVMVSINRIEFAPHLLDLSNQRGWHHLVLARGRLTRVHHEVGRAPAPGVLWLSFQGTLPRGQSQSEHASHR
jgi:hypothetical protein